MITALLLVTVGALLSAPLVGVLRRARRPLATKKPDEPPVADSVVESNTRALCKIDDVVVLSSGEEAWLSSALVLEEATPRGADPVDSYRTVATLFVAPERGADRAVYAGEKRNLHWLTAIEPPIPTGQEPPSALEHDGRRFERSRRLPVGFRRLGADAPDLGERGVVGEYAGDGDASLVLLVGARATRAWAGRRLSEGAYEVWPSAERR